MRCFFLEPEHFRTLPESRSHDIPGSLLRWMRTQGSEIRGTQRRRTGGLQKDCCRNSFPTPLQEQWFAALRLPPFQREPNSTPNPNSGARLLELGLGLGLTPKVKKPLVSYGVLVRNPFFVRDAESGVSTSGSYICWCCWALWHLGLRASSEVEPWSSRGALSVTYDCSCKSCAFLLVLLQ